MGSVKNLNVRDEATDTELGLGEFVFSDDYSVFDWGKMPDVIERKGEVLCMMGGFNFELLEREGIATHYLGLVDDGDVKETTDLSRSINRMAIALTQVPPLRFSDGEYNYTEFLEKGGENYLIPLEVVFRNSVPIGSSLRDRKNPKELGLDMDEWPENAVDLEEPMVEYSTKFEEKDRYLERDEAREISGLGEGLSELEEIALSVNELITDMAEQNGLSHEDGKIECIYHRGDILVADVIGTFDENRFLYRDEQVSKEFIRQFYKSYDPVWVSDVEGAKKKADEKEVADWRELCSVDPKPLPEDITVLEATDTWRANGSTLHH